MQHAPPNLMRTGVVFELRGAERILTNHVKCRTHFDKKSSASPDRLSSYQSAAAIASPSAAGSTRKFTARPGGYDALQSLVSNAPVIYQNLPRKTHRDHRQLFGG